MLNLTIVFSYFLVMDPGLREAPLLCYKMSEKRQNTYHDIAHVPMLYRKCHCYKTKQKIEKRNKYTIFSQPYVS